MLINPYIAVLVLFLVVTGFLVTMLVLSTVLGPKMKTRTKQLPFECGSVSVGNVNDQRFGVRFYLVAMLFILFDIEVIFMYPWAVLLEKLSWPGLYAMLTFMVVVVGGLYYVWRKGVLNWND